MDNTTNMNKNKFKMIASNDESELEDKLKAHRKKIWKRVILVILIILTLLLGVYLYFTLITFHDVKVLDTTLRSDSSAEKYEEFAGSVLKYSNDGAFYTNQKDDIIWNQTYEMQNPILDICQKYVAIADKSGTDVYIMNNEEIQGHIKTTLPIFQVRVAAQGTVAVLMEDNGVSYLQLYDKNATLLASGELHAQNSGYPIAIALSDDAKKLAVSMLNISNTKVKTTIAFYNFGSVGQNEIDNIVSSYSYADEVFPRLEFFNKNQMIAFGDQKIAIFSGTQKPVRKKTITLKKEAKSIFYNDKYFGLITNNEDQKNTRHVDIYSLDGTKILAKNFDMDYTNIEFLKNNEICIYNEKECQIYSIYGIKRFSGKFDVSLHKVLSGITKWNYTFILEGKTQEVILK